MEQKRIEWVDTVKFICMLAVIVSHLNHNNPDTVLKHFYLPFYLTGFLFTSGYVYRFQRGFSRHLAKKARQLLVPWLLFSLMCIFSANLFTFNPGEHESLKNEILRNFLQIRGYGDEMWFVAALFVAFIPFYFIIGKYEESIQNKDAAFRKLLISSLILYLINCLYTEYIPGECFPWKTNSLPWHIEYIPYALSFMIAGYLFRERFEAVFSERNTLRNRLLLLIAYLLLTGVPPLAGVSMNRRVDIIYTLLKIIAGLSLIISFSMAAHSCRFVSFVGRNTMTYFALHGKMTSAVEMLFQKLFLGFVTAVFGSKAIFAPYSIMFGFLIAALLVIPSVIINSFFPFMLGKWYKKSKMQ